MISNSKCCIVKFVKSRSKEIANVGIGIFGKEGNQAAFNSDYAFY